MEKKAFDELKKEIAEAMSKPHLGGLKGEVLHKYIRAFATAYHFKRIQKQSGNIEKMFGDLGNDIEHHFVVKSEGKEFKIVKEIVKNHVHLYFTVHSLLLYERYDLGEFRLFAKQFFTLSRQKGIPKETAYKAYRKMMETAEEWKGEIEKFRTRINSAWATARGKTGWSLALFEKMHKEGYFVRYQERRAFKESLKDESAVEKLINNLNKIKSKEELDKLIDNIGVKEKEMVRDFAKIMDFIFSSWDNSTQQMNRLVEVIAKAGGIHELPEADSKQMEELHRIINESLNERYLHALRLDDKQLEAELVELKDAIEQVKKAA